jgi:hypothetical protein
LPAVAGVPKLVPLDFIRLKDRAQVRNNGAAKQNSDLDDPVPF